MNYQRLFTSNETLSDLGKEFDKELHAAIGPVLEKYIKLGADSHDMEAMATAAVTTEVTNGRLLRQVQVRRAERLAAQQEEHTEVKLRRRAQQMYAESTDSQTIHCNRFPAWTELSLPVQGHWLAKAAAAIAQEARDGVA